MLEQIKHCRECGGTGQVIVEGIHPSSVGRVSTMEAPDRWKEECPNCQGSGLDLDSTEEDDVQRR
jgi:hypothetical protein